MQSAVARLSTICLIAISMIVIAAGPVFAVPRLEQWLSPDLGNFKPTLRYEGSFYPASDVENQNTDMSISVHALSGAMPLHQTNSDELVLTAKAGYAFLSTEAVLPGTGRKLPNNLWDLNAGLNYRHSLGDGWLWGVFGNLGSPSNKPFNSFEEMDVGLTGFLRMPHGERNAWLFLLNYTNNRDFLSGAPIPGVAYLYHPNDKFKAILGAPLLALRYSPFPKWSASLYYMYPRNVDARVTWRAFKRFSFYTGFDWSNYRFYLTDRAHRQDRLFYFQKRGFVGSNIKLGRGLILTLETGYSFDRLFFEGENYGDRHQERIDLDNNWFAALRVGVEF